MHAILQNGELNKYGCNIVHVFSQDEDTVYYTCNINSLRITAIYAD